MGKRITRKSLNLTLNSVALGIAAYRAHASLYSQHYRSPSHDRLIDIVVPCGTGFLHRVKRPTAVRSAYIRFLVVLAPADRHRGTGWI